MHSTGEAFTDDLVLTGQIVGKPVSPGQDGFSSASTDGESDASKGTAAHLRDLRSIVDQLVAGDPHDLSVDELKAEIVDLRRIIDRLEARFVRTVRVFDARKGFKAGKHPALTMTAWLKDHCRMTGNDASGRVRVGRHLQKLDATEKAFAAGDIGFSHARVITKLIEDVGEKPTQQSEPALIEAAHKMDAGKLNTITTRIKYYYNPDGSLEEDNKKYERRRLHISETFEGLTVLDGLFDAEAGAVIKAAVNALSGPPSKDDVRNPAQRRADALAELCRRQLDGGGLPESGGQRPHLIVTVDAATLSGAKQTGSSAASNTDFEPDKEIVPMSAFKQQPTFGSAEISPTGTVVHGETARRLSCDAIITRIVLDAKSQPIDVGRATRVISAAQRKALAVRDKNCQFPGCDLPPEWCDAHHLTFWRRGGTTNLANLILLCRRHHRFVHENEYDLVIEHPELTNETVALENGEPP